MLHHNGKANAEYRQVGFISEIRDCLRDSLIVGLLVATLVALCGVAWLINS